LRLQPGNGNGLGISIVSAGNVTIAAPSSGSALIVNTISDSQITVNATSGQYSTVLFNNAGTQKAEIYYDNTNTNMFVGSIVSASVGLYTTSTQRMLISNAGNVTINTPSSGVALALTGFAGSSALTIATTGMQVGSPTGADEGAGTINVSSGYYINGTNVLTIVQNSQAEPYTCVLADLGKSVYCTTNGGTVTIPANSSVAYPLGAAITFVAASGVTLTIAITTDTLTLAGTSTTGSRTLAANGVATALKVTSTSWIIGGSGLT
jgi:hypothetical protein